MMERNCNLDNPDHSFENLFERKFNFEKQKDWELPSDFHNHNSWIIKSLYDMKQDLNSTKSLLNDKGKEWHEYTASINKASLVMEAIKKLIQPEILTQAWCKFYEILSSFNLIPKDKPNLKTLHLCEAPGAFISALNYYLCVNFSEIYWEWIANALNPYYEGHSIRNAVVDDRLLFPTLKNWYFGQDNTGDITDSTYIDDICNFACESEHFDLITADGSVDCISSPGEQELVVAKLHFAEILIALSSLLPSGCLVIKKFTFFECVTISELYLLNCVFEKVHVFKPFTSKPSNSEVYVICIGFHRSEALTLLLQQYKHLYRTNSTLPVFPDYVIPKSFICQVEECMRIFTNFQICAIKENLALYLHKPDLDVQKTNEINETKQVCAEMYIKKYSVRPSLVYDACKLYSIKKTILTSFCDKKKRNHKILYFQAVGDTFNNIVKSSSMLWRDKLLDIQNRIDLCFPLTKKRHLEEIEWHFPSREIRKAMKNKTFQNWITLGKQVICIQNSKFCYPLVLHLWNKISHESGVDVQHHLASELSWNLEAVINLLKEDKLPSNYLVVPVSASDNCYEIDQLLLYLKGVFGSDKTYHPDMHIGAERIPSDRSKIIYINSTMWVSSLHQELIIKKSLTEVVYFILKFLEKGDTLLICVQSVLTRYMAGLFFMMVSLFEKFTTVLPEDSALAAVGHIWIFKNFQEPKWMDNVNQHLVAIKEFNSSAEKEILEIVPMRYLCGNAFYVILRDLNNKHLLPRIRNFIAVEKCKIAM